MTKKAATPRDAAPQEGTTASRTTDWDAIERSYRAGILTIREIARQHEITEGAIRKRAKKDGWQRDLTGRVQEAVRTQLVRSEVRTEDAAHQVSEKQVVAEAAATIVSIVREHRADIRRNRELAATLYEQLADAVGNRDALRELIEQECDPGPEPSKADEAKAEARRNAMLKAVSLPTHIVAAKDLSMILRNLVALEREAFNVGGDRDQVGPAPYAGMPALPGLDALVAKLGQA